MIQISSNCVGCGKCVSVCPFGALSLVNGKAVASSACTMCGACVSQCPVKALSLPQSTAAVKDLSAYKGVWVFVELLEEKGVLAPRSVSLELLTKGRELANELKEDLCAVVIGKSNGGYFAELASYGADKIYNVEGPGYADYNTEAYANAMITLINKYKPSIVLFPSTYVGRDLSPSRLNGGLHRLIHKRRQPYTNQTRFRRQYHGRHQMPQPPPANGDGKAQCNAKAGNGARQDGSNYKRTYRFKPESRESKDYQQGNGAQPRGGKT